MSELVGQTLGHFRIVEKIGAKEGVPRITL
jgi:hypothetical protein